MKIQQLIVLLCFSQVLHTQNNRDFFDPELLKPGMKGYALTVFQGLEPEKMDLEVIAYMPNRMAKAGLVLIRLYGENIERTRVARGMSGSPVYIDGKLLGALAYTWSDSLELLAGVVPIGDMLSDKTRGKNISFSAINQAKPIQTAWSIEGISQEMLQNHIDSPSESYSYGIEEFITVKSSRSNGIAPLKPGDAVAVKLMEGDIEIASIGTVTYVDGEDVYIYGHPMDSEGPVNLPLSRAEIFDIMPSSYLSFKMGRSLPETIGSTVFDGLSSVYGRFDKQAVTIPFNMFVNSKNTTNTYSVKIARSRKYLPMLLSYGIGAILERELGKNIEKQVQLSWTIKLTNNQVISNNVTWVRHSVYDPRTISEYWREYISILWNNTLTHLVPKDIEIKLNILDKPYNYYSVQEVKPLRSEYFVGETVDLQVTLQKYLTKSFQTNISLDIPNHMQDGSYTVIVGSQIAIDAELARIFPHNYTIRTPQQLIKQLVKPINTHVLQAILINTSTGSIVGNSHFGSIPKFRNSLFKSKTIDRKSILAPKLVDSKIEFDDPVLGGQVIILDIISPAPVRS